MIAKQPFPVSDVSIRVPATRALGLGLGLAAGFWCAVLVLSHPALAFDTRWPSGADLHPLGAPAAWLARLTWSMFGWAAPLAPLVLAMLSAGLWRRRVGWFLKALGALAVLVALPVVLVPARALEEHLPQSGSGGLWGDWLVAAAHEAGRDGWLIPVAWGMTVLGCLTSLGMGPWQMLGKLTVGKAAPVPNATPAAPPKAAVKRTRVVVPPSEPVDKPAEESTEAATAFLTSVPLAVEPAVPVTVGPSIPIHHHASTPPVSESVAASVVRPLTDTKAAEFAFYKAPTIAILDEPEPFAVNQHEELLRTRAGQLEQAFRDFGINVKVVGINTGPVITQFELSLETGLRLNKVTRLGDDIALNLKVPSVRMVAPIPGKNTVGVEIPNELRANVRLKEVMTTGAPRLASMKIPLFLGKDNEGRALVHDLADMPHLLIAGSTGTGKSVCMNSIILSILMTRRPDEVRMIMIDPKVVELSDYGRIPHLMHSVVHDMRKAEAILSWAVDKMEERYELFRRVRVRNIASFNEVPQKERNERLAAEPGEGEDPGERMPYIVVFIDEMADLMMMMRKEVETHIIRLAQKSRAAGIHLVVATQKPTVDVITGLIKSNLPSRICFKVVNKSDSRVVLDEMGADRLLGKGDLLFLPPGTSQLVRAQGTYASDGEIRRVVGSIEGDPCYVQELMHLKVKVDEDGAGKGEKASRPRDEMYIPAVEVVLREGRGSTSLLQRTLGIGYGRAARLIDAMAEEGIVGSYNGSSARDVLMSPEQWASSKTPTH